MTIKVIPQDEQIKMPVITRKPPCRCGCSKFRVASRIENEPGVAASIMYECVECGEYRL